MIQSSIDATLQSLQNAEQAKPWNQQSVASVVRLLNAAADLFLACGNALALETADRMGVTPGEVWLETVFPSVWGLLSTAEGIRAGTDPSLPLNHCRSRPANFRHTNFANHDAVQVLPANAFESLLLPGFTGHVLLNPIASARPRIAAEKPAFAEPVASGLALCLLPFNLASIGVLDIVHLLCFRQQRVVAKISEKVEFVGPHLQKILAPFIEAGALRLVRGGPDVGAQLAARPEFSHIHLTGSTRTAQAVTQIASAGRVSAELGGVTLAIVFPDALSSPASLRHTARQVAFGALANNGQHCVSFQAAIVPSSKEELFAEALWKEMTWAARRGGSQEGRRSLVDAVAAKRVETLTSELSAKGARLTPVKPAALERHFPACLIRGIDEKMRIFREEAFGPIIGLLPLPERDFSKRALALANSNEIAGDLGVSLFTAAPGSPETRRIATEMRHGMVMINTYPGVAFATSLPWGAGAAGFSGNGWVHNYRFLPESQIKKVVLTAPLGRKGLGPVRWDDPWLLNVSGENTVRFAKALIRATVAYFRKQPLRFVTAQLLLLTAIARRELASRRADKLDSGPLRIEP